MRKVGNVTHFYYDLLGKYQFAHYIILAAD